jgi:hypothetical protein
MSMSGLTTHSGIRSSSRDAEDAAAVVEEVSAALVADEGEDEADAAAT